MNMLVVIKIFSIINNLSKQKTPRPNGFTFKEKIMPIFYNLFQKIDAGVVLPNSLYGVRITLIKPHKDITKKKNHRPIRLMNIHAKLRKTSYTWCLLAGCVKSHVILIDCFFL